MMPPTSAKPAVTGSVKKGYKSKSKQPISTADQLKRCFTSLCAQIDGGHFSNALKTCDKSGFRGIEMTTILILGL